MVDVYRYDTNVVQDNNWALYELYMPSCATEYSAYENYMFVHADNWYVKIHEYMIHDTLHMFVHAGMKHKGVVTYLSRHCKQLATDYMSN